MQRNFAYIDDIIEGVMRVMEPIPADQESELIKAYPPYKIYNIGNNQHVTLRSFITAIETACGQKAEENLLPMQQGYITITYADVDDLILDTGFKPSTSIEEGIGKFMEWYKKYYA